MFTRFLDPAVAADGIRINFRNGSKSISHPEQNQSFTLDIICNASVNGTEMGKVESNGTNTKLTIQSDSGCARLKASHLYEFIRDHKNILFIVGFFIGTIVCFMGFRLAQPVLFILGFCIAFLPVIVLHDLLLCFCILMKILVSLLRRFCIPNYLIGGEIYFPWHQHFTRSYRWLYCLHS
jgi:hypothetical protein